MLKIIFIFIICAAWIPLVTAGKFIDNGSLKLSPEYSEPTTANDQVSTIESSIVLYGVNGCPYTAKAEKALKNRGIVYRYMDLNSDEFRKNHERRVLDSFAADGYETVKHPFLEVNGKMYQDPDLYKVIGGE